MLAFGKTISPFAIMLYLDLGLVDMFISGAGHLASSGLCHTFLPMQGKEERQGEPNDLAG